MIPRDDRGGTKKLGTGGFRTFGFIVVAKRRSIVQKRKHDSRKENKKKKSACVGDNASQQLADDKGEELQRSGR